MKNRSTLFILIGIVVLGAFIWIQEYARARNPGKVLEQRLFNLDPSTLLSIEFHHTNGVARFEKRSGTWWAVDASGAAGPADSVLIARMINGLNSNGKGTTITEKQMEVRGLDASAYGFDQPMARIVASDNLGRHEWLIGRLSPVGKIAYAKAADEQNVYTIPARVLAMIPLKADLLRDRSLFSNVDATARRIEVRGAEGFVQLMKEPQGDWRLTQPVSALADAKEIDAFLRSLHSFRVEEFEADEVSDFVGYGLEDEARSVSVMNSEGATRALIVGDAVPERSGLVYARRAGENTVFTMTDQILRLVNAPAARFRDARLLTVPLATVSSVTVSRGEERLALAIDPERRWKVVSPVVWAAHPRRIADLILLWSAAVITEFNVAAPPAAPEWVFEFGSAEAGVTNRIEVFPRNGARDGLLIRCDGGPAIHRINLPLVPDTCIDPLRFKDNLVWGFERARVSKVSLRRAGDPEQVVARLPDGAFGPIGTNAMARLNEAAFERVLAKLAAVKTPRYIAYNPPDLKRYGLDAPRAELHIGLSGTNELGRVLMVGHETAEGVYSMVKGRDVVFYLAPSDVDVLTADLVTEVAPIEPPDE